MIVSPYFEPSSQDDKVSCVFAVGIIPGHFMKRFVFLADRKVNPLKLESRPRPGKPWEYLFYVDWEGNLKEDMYQDMIKELSVKTSFCVFWEVIKFLEES